MFVFEKLQVYKKALCLYKGVSALKFSQNLEGVIITKQLLRASLSVSLNIAEGAGKKSKRDRRNFLLISRGSLYETVAILNVLESSNSITRDQFEALYAEAEEISKMLFVMIKKLEAES